MARRQVERSCCFNPRARVGRDRLRATLSARRRRFNPRARVGRDKFNRPQPHRHRPFQSTRPRRARRQPEILCVVGSGRPFQSTRPRRARLSHHNSLRDKDFFYEIREPMSPVDPKGTGQVATTQKANEINKLLKCEPSRESRAA